MIDDSDRWPLQATVADTDGLDIQQLIRIIEAHYTDVHGNPVQVIRGGAHVGYPSGYYRIKSRVQTQVTT